ncbi:MAG: DUF4430 domain-containing protein [Promethearchaeota archaeon]
MKNHLFLGLLILSTLSILITPNASDYPQAMVTIHGSLAIDIELTIDYGNTTQQFFSGQVGATVFDILNQTSNVTFTQYPYGKFITSINGIENNANNNGRYWQYWVNDELAPVAADNYFLTDGDQVLWKYLAPETIPTTPTGPSPELMLGLGLIIFIGVVTVIAASIIYLKIR